MKLNLGKIFFIICLPYIIYAQVILKAPSKFYKGEAVSFSIIATGGDIKIPPIASIDGISVHSTGTSTQTTVKNGVRSYIFTKSYSFLPEKDITIPSFSIKIDNKIQKTQPQKLVMVKVEKTNSKYYSLDIKVDKNDGYVGEGIVFDLIFKYRKDLSVIGLNFDKPNFDNFWVKELKNNQEQLFNDNYRYQKLTYLLFPQKSGKLEISPLKIDIVTRENIYSNNFFLSSSTKNIPVYSNKIKLNIKELPQGINLIGDFNIVSTIDKTNLESGDAVSYKVTISGRGNIDDIDEIKLNIPHTTIYENPSTKKYNMKNNQYGGIYTKTFSIVATNDFTIPSITIKYFDKNSKTIKTIKTKDYNIEVKSLPQKDVKLEVAQLNQTQIIQKDEITTKVIKTSDNQKIIYFLFGLLAGLISSVLYYLYKTKTFKKEDKPIIKKIKNIKIQEKLFKTLIVYINIDKNLDKLIYRLENKLEDKDLKSIKKDILVILNKLDKKDIKLDI